MADNFKLTEPTAGTVFKSKQVGGLQIPGKILYAEDGTPINFGTMLTALAALATALAAPATATGQASIATAVAGVTTAITALGAGQNDNGRALPIDSAPVVAASQTYETVATGQTAQIMGASGAAGDYLEGILVIPGTTSPGAVTLLDGATSIPVFAGGASSVSGLIPLFIPIGAISASGAWKITTGANVSVIAVGNFT